MEKERKLIYADSLREAEEHVFFVGGRGGKTKALLDSMIDRLIKDAPPVDAVEVVHGKWEYGRWEKGHWVKGNERCQCSVCHRDFAVDNLNIWNGCPHCLAKMDGKE